MKAAGKGVGCCVCLSGSRVRFAVSYLQSPDTAWCDTRAPPNPNTRTIQRTVRTLVHTFIHTKVHSVSQCHTPYSRSISVCVVYGTGSGPSCNHVVVPC